MVSALISLMIFVVYLIFALRYIKNVPVSLSETFYLIKFPYAFTFVMWAMAFLLLPAMLSITPDLWQFLAFLALAGICFVGAAPMFKESFDGKVHTTGAYVAAMFGILWSLIVTAGWPFLVTSVFICLAGSVMTDSVKHSRTWWLEMVAFGTVYLSTIFALL